MVNETPDNSFEYGDYRDEPWYENGTADPETGEEQTWDGIADWLDQIEVRAPIVVETWADLPANDPDRVDHKTGQARQRYVLSEDLLVYDDGTEWRALGGLGSANRPLPEQHVESLHAGSLNDKPATVTWADKGEYVLVGLVTPFREASTTSTTYTTAWAGTDSYRLDSTIPQRTSNIEGDFYVSLSGRMRNTTSGETAYARIQDHPDTEVSVTGTTWENVGSSIVAWTPGSSIEHIRPEIRTSDGGGAELIQIGIEVFYRVET